MFKCAYNVWNNGVSVDLEIHYYSAYSEVLYVTGWWGKQDDTAPHVSFTNRMKWNRGHVWMTSISVPPTADVISYKYFVFSDTEQHAVRWERVPERVVRVTPADDPDWRTRQPIMVRDAWDTTHVAPTLLPAHKVWRTKSNSQKCDHD
ncbi:hypothetical protein Pelo_2402 [Pelomyxa schiedti]|nr:hypothetical protein Pelo_2402 [Pelomyxa schiedti]